MRWHSKASFDCLLYRQHFCQKISKSIHVCQSYSKPKMGRFFETRCIHGSDSERTHHQCQVSCDSGGCSKASDESFKSVDVSTTSSQRSLADLRGTCTHIYTSIHVQTPHSDLTLPPLFHSRLPRAPGPVRRVRLLKSYFIIIPMHVMIREVIPGR